MCLLVLEYVDSLVPCLKTENDVKICLSTWVTLCPIGIKGVDIKNPLFYLVYLRLFGALPDRTYPQYRLCGLFMIMKHSCDDINYHE